MPLAHGVRSRTQIIVGTSSSSIATTVKTASSSEITIDWYSASSATRFVHACSGAPAGDQVAGGEVGHRVQREQEEQPERHPQRRAKDLAAQRGAPHRSHLAVRRTSAL